MKTGLILEGGAMRGMFTAGVLDVLMEQGITVDGMVGVSAGAVFGCNYKSHQIGRTIRYNTTYCNDKRYASFRNLLRTGNLYSEDFCYHEVPEKLDPFDDKAFRESPMDYFVVCTDVRTGDPIYHKCRTGDAEDVRWMEASASMPLAAKIVKIGHYGLLDGGVADSIPIRFFESIGYKRNLIILTQPKGFVKKKNPMLPAIRARYLRYPAFVEAVADRHERYNETLSYISMLEQSGKDYVIRPPIPLEIGAMERDPDQLRRVYETGRARRSCREFTDKPIKSETLHQLLEAAMSGPSCVNARDWSFVVVTDPEKLAQMADANGRPAEPLRKAAAGILVCGDLDRAFRFAKDYWVIDGAIAAQNICLAAQELGLGAVWLGTWPQMDRVEAQQKLFALPKTIVPHSIIALGYPEADLTVPRESRYEDDRVHFNQW